MVLWRADRDIRMRLGGVLPEMQKAALASGLYEVEKPGRENRSR
jgi:hypothetical protein